MPSSTTPSTTTIRRVNVLSLYQVFAEEQVATGSHPVGIQQEFAAKVGIGASMWSQIKSARPISDKLARQIEHSCGKPAGWLDEERAPMGLTAGEQHFLTVALRAYRSTNAEGRKRLRTLLKAGQF